MGIIIGGTDRIITIGDFMGGIIMILFGILLFTLAAFMVVFTIVGRTILIDIDTVMAITAILTEITDTTETTVITTVV